MIYNLKMYKFSYKLPSTNTGLVHFFRTKVTMRPINGITKPQVLVLWSMLSMITVSTSIFPQVHVTVRNQLDNNQNLALHCKSKNDDLGRHVVPYGGTYGFHFTPNILGSTLFYWSMQWKRASNHFDIYNWKRDDSLCEEQCSWIVKNEGPCMQNTTTGVFDICYQWPN